MAGILVDRCVSIVEELQSCQVLDTFSVQPKGLAEGMCVGCEREAGSARTSRSGLSKYRRELPSVELNRAVGICAFFWVEFSGATLGGSYLYQHLLLASAGQKRRKRIMFVEGLIFTSHYWVVYYA